MSLELALFVLRILVGLLFVGHGAQKLFGWFGGPGFAGFSGWLESLGLRPARTWALIAAAGEFGGGLLMALGLLNPLGPLAIMGSMLMAAIKVHWPKGLWVSNGGYEYPLVLFVLSGVLALLGPGAISFDAALGTELPMPLTFWAGLVAVVAVVAVGATAHRAPAGRERTA
jgi:putative oxidoreductase